MAELTGLADDRALLGRTSTAERVSDILRSRIAEGYFPPGTRLSEDSIGGALGVSRNTLREAFRLLTHERLLVHELNRGVFVRVLTIEDVEDIYRTRTSPSYDSDRRSNGVAKRLGEISTDHWADRCGRV
ncbi:GntR family transcriptional regulator, partial [Streptomyces sp. NPDC057927]